MRSTLLAVLGCLTACASAAPIPGPEAALPVKEGHDLYLAKCTLCHDVVGPGEHPRAEWPQLVDHYAPRAKLHADDRARILAYLEEYSR